MEMFIILTKTRLRECYLDLEVRREIIWETEKQAFIVLMNKLDNFAIKY